MKKIVKFINYNINNNNKIKNEIKIKNWIKKPIKMIKKNRKIKVFIHYLKTIKKCNWNNKKKKILKI